MYMIKLKQLLMVYKTKTRIAELFGISKQAVSKWAMDAPIPEVYELKLKHEIAPEVFGVGATSGAGMTPWYVEHWLYQETDDFNLWWMGEQGAGPPEGDEDGYYTRKGFSLMGWLAAMSIK